MSKENYEKIINETGKWISELENDDKIRLAGSIIQIVSELENVEYFCMESSENKTVLMLTGESANKIKKLCDAGILRNNGDKNESF